MSKYLKQSRVERVLALFEYPFVMPDTDKVVSIEIESFNVCVYYEGEMLPFRTDGT